MIERVRAAAVGDAAVLAWLDGEARAHLADRRGGPEWLAEVSAWNELDAARFVGTDECCVLVAELDDVPVGYAAAVCIGAVCRVERLYVDPQARELGLGEEMLDQLMDFAARTGVERIESTALPGDRETKNLFERFGMKARLLVVSRRLTEPDDDAS